MAPVTVPARPLDLRDSDELTRLADVVAGRYLLSRAEGRTIRHLVDSELRDLLALVGDLRARFS